jgi:hypothetical protein
MVAPPAQRLAGDGLGAGRRPGLAVLEIVIMGAAGMLDRRGPVGAGVGGPGGAFP